jgi:tRNA dimethylallyltransferase
MNKPHIIVVCGPTATGKSDRAVELAKSLRSGGEVISADSRQVYKYLDIGSGKITPEEMQGIPHYMLDVCKPSEIYSVVDFQKEASKNIEDIFARGKTPIICGGTGMYIDTLVYNTQFPEVPANAVLRKELENKTTEELQDMLQELDIERYEDIDIQNPVRLIRAIEIATALGSVPKLQKENSYDVEWIYLDFPDEILKERIHTRLYKRIDMGMIQEVENLITKNLATYERLESLGLEYRYISRYLKGDITLEQMLEQLEKEIWRYAKRQRRWFKKYAK